MLHIITWRWLWIRKILLRSKTSVCCLLGILQIVIKRWFVDRPDLTRLRTNQLRTPTSIMYTPGIPSYSARKWRRSCPRWELFPQTAKARLRILSPAAFSKSSAPCEHSPRRSFSHPNLLPRVLLSRLYRMRLQLLEPNSIPL